MLRSVVMLVVISTTIAVASPALGANVAVIMSSKVEDYKEALRGFREVAKHRIVAEYDMGGDPEKGPSIIAEIVPRLYLRTQGSRRRDDAEAPGAPWRSAPSRSRALL